MHKIGELNENHLHAALKAWYARSQDQVEVTIADGYVIDVVLDDLLVEIQMGNFSGHQDQIGLSGGTLSPAPGLSLIAHEKWLFKLPKEETLRPSFL